MEAFELVGDKFVCNIAQPENSPGGLFMVNRDPRKHRLPPDAYVGIVERVGPDCQLIYVGQKIVVRRYIYKQFDLDSERIIAREHQVLMLDDKTPFPGVVVIKLKSEEIKTTIIVPETVKDKRKRAQSYEGTIIASSSSGCNIGDHIWIEKRDSGQYFLSRDILVFKNEPDSMTGDLPILCKMEKIPELQLA